MALLDSRIFFGEMQEKGRSAAGGKKREKEKWGCSAYFRQKPGKSYGKEGKDML